MHQRRRRALATTAAGALALTALAGSPAAAEEGPEQLQNGSFSNGGDLSPWYAYGVASQGVVNGEYCVTTNAGAGDPWITAIGVNDVPIVAGETYAFTFKARASTGVTINANVQKGEPNWNQALGATPDITTEQQTFRYTFPPASRPRRVRSPSRSAARARSSSASTTSPCAGARRRTSTSRTRPRASASTRSATCPTAQSAPPS
ncbi:MAG: carbohydrate binding domain-containing protein [Actinomycetota bacterium]|nr:carbohydrate binding domain-containing protein [Actinomycetota bacterium]